MDVKADSDVRADDRRGKEETRFCGHDFRSTSQRLGVVADWVTCRVERRRQGLCTII